MRAIFRYTLNGLRAAILGWGIALAVLGAYILSFYDTIVQQREAWERLLQMFPKELLAFFGEVERFTTPEGYLDSQFFSLMPVILGVYAVLVGASLLAEPEERGVLDLLMGHPISRSAFFFGRWLAFAAATVAILGLTWLGFMLGKPLAARLEVTPGALALPFFSLLAVLMLFAHLAIFLSQILPSRNMAAMVAGLLLGASFFITALARINPDLETINQLSPLAYYQGGLAIHGLKLDWFLSLLTASLVFLMLAWWRFERRDLRVSGEGSWGFPWRRPPSSVSKGP
ncbi:ABC transporter permease subunit [Thermoflexus sp.]|uniref:ABC transporter permease subunit n=1 Tax=Thermoflexus sp. TaxID=1969742 RepID=UPI0025D24957|nr:ABC transporter permease subunit [Thermoflexus sp.]MDW8179641.1 ABC transporter permease subunit [Anaerolineae bacterium]MCS6963431.1 ABC transporter permease [Thermoflexus sp.]MCS7350192.1 ABC transporter permease [Thermoflexus sp.]MCX7689557.1 ABC transporter permease [Thermoflexus sp.]MDW8186379.1 ABC transporter permease subunit [Anaerolineae bacterium]